MIFLLSYEIQGENPKFVLATTKFLTSHAGENPLQLSREEKDRNIFFHIKVNICLYLDTTKGWNHITWIVELHCLGSTTFRTRERYSILDSNSIQYGFNYIPLLCMYHNYKYRYLIQNPGFLIFMCEINDFEIFWLFSY